MTPEDVITSKQIGALSSRRVWVVEMVDGFMGYHWVPVPDRWRELKRWVFPDVFNQGDLILIEYDTHLE
jgi:hypothetical protein